MAVATINTSTKSDSTMRDFLERDFSTTTILRFSFTAWCKTADFEELLKKPEVSYGFFK